MRGKRHSTGFRAALVIVTVALFVTTAWAATHERVVHTFSPNGTDGLEPQAGLIFDAVGNLYGTTSFGGTYDSGTVFELTPKAGGGWTETVLYSFNRNGTDGYDPFAGLIFDAAGNLYGTTYSGGTYGSGTVFELTPKAGGGWTEQVLYSFCAQTDCTDGDEPYAGLIFDAAGNLYGTTFYGGTYGYGTVFELTPEAGGGWTEKVVYSFNPNNGTDGAYPYAGLIFDNNGNLYGTTSYGGTYDYGMVFELTPAQGGGWTEQVLYSFNFNGTDGYGPLACLIFDKAGNLFGTTVFGGTYDSGTVFELTPAEGGGWTEKVPHSFNGRNDGANPYAGLILDENGNLYGTTAGGQGRTHEAGANNAGTVFELMPTKGGGWAEKVLHSFSSNGRDGASPGAGLIFDAAGNLYGTTSLGGPYGFGTVFEITH